MASTPLDLVLVSTPIGYLGSGRGGGVELTITTLLRGLGQRGHHIHLEECRYLEQNQKSLSQTFPTF